MASGSDDPAMASSSAAPAEQLPPAAAEELVEGGEAPPPPERPKGAMWCITCNTVKLAARSHKSRAKQHMLRPATEQEIAKFLADKEAAKAGQAVPPTTEGQPAGGGSSSGAGAVAASAGINEYSMEFGKYKRKDLHFAEGLACTKN